MTSEIPHRPPPERRHDDGYVVRLARPGEQDQIDELFEVVFGRRRPRDEWVWRYEQAPGGPPLVIVLEKDGRIVGHRVSAIHSALLDGSPISIGVAADAMVHPDHRGHAGLRRMVDYLAEHGEYDFRIVFPTDAGASAVRSRHPERVGVLPQWVRWLTVRGIIASRPGTSAVVATTVVGLQRRIAAAGRRAGGRMAVSPLEALGDEVDGLARRCSRAARAIRVRDARYLRWRWQQHVDGPRLLIGARDRRGELGALATVALDEPASERLGASVHRIVDIVSDRPTAQLAAVAGAVDAARAEGADVVLFDYQDRRRWARWTCRLSGFAARGEGVNVVIHPLSSWPDPPLLPGDWYLTYGDTDLC